MVKIYKACSMIKLLPLSQLGLWQDMHLQQKKEFWGFSPSQTYSSTLSHSYCKLWILIFQSSKINKEEIYWGPEKYLLDQYSYSVTSILFSGLALYLELNLPLFYLLFFFFPIAILRNVTNSFNSIVVLIQIDHMYENLAGILSTARFNETSHISSVLLYMQACVMRADCLCLS